MGEGLETLAQQQRSALEARRAAMDTMQGGRGAAQPDACMQGAV